MMNRLRLTLVSAALLATGVLFIGNGAGRFDTKLSKDQQILQALNRLTFGPRPGDIEEVRRLGVDKWIDLQLHPDRIPENAALDAKLKPLETLRMAPSEVLKEYIQGPFGLGQVMRANVVLPQDAFRRVNTGTIEERQAVLNSLDPEKRQQVLAMLSPQTFPCAPDLQKEIEAARKAQNEARSKEIRQRMPPLRDLLSQEQMNTAMRGNPEQITALLNELDPVKRQQVAAALPPRALAELPELRRDGMRLRQPQQVVIEDLKEGKVLRALYSNRQLEEVLVDFWFNHFNVYEAKQNDRPLLASFERDAIRPNVFGHFKDLLLATARHPAMLYYLDNWESMSPDVFDIGPFAGPAQQVMQQAQRQARGLNENYGRELMELHTLGVNGGYTQQDVIAVARAFTGWTVRKPNTQPEFVFAGFMHDMGEKVVLGHKIVNNGEQDGLQVIDILAHHPSTAKFISRKLAQRFVADDPPQSLVDRMAATFTKTDGDLRAVMQTMFSSTEFFSEGAWQAKMKSPLEMVVSAVRAVGGETTDAFTLAQKIADLGEPLYGKVEPTGYPNTGETWLNTAGLLGRMSFAAALASGQISGVKTNGTDLDGKDTAAIAHALLGRDPSAQTLDAIEKGVEGKERSPRVLAGLVMSSPDFQRR
jgi:uncharacterized protein (DUF1800 family)